MKCNLINYLINLITQQYFLSTCPVSSTGLDDGKIKMTKLWAISLRILKTSKERLTYKELKYTRVLEMLGEKLQLGSAATAEAQRMVHLVLPGEEETLWFIKTQKKISRTCDTWMLRGYLSEKSISGSLINVNEIRELGNSMACLEN